MRVAFTLEEETLSHFLFTTMGKRALLGAAGVLAVVGVYYLYQQYPAQPEQKPEAAPATPPSKKESTVVEVTTTNAFPPQQAAQPSDDDSSRSVARLQDQPLSPHTDPNIQEPASLTATAFKNRAPQPLSEFWHVEAPKEASAHSKQDPRDPDAVLVEHGSGDDIMQADGVTQASYIKPPSP